MILHVLLVAVIWLPFIFVTVYGVWSYANVSLFWVDCWHSTLSHVCTLAIFTYALLSAFTLPWISGVGRLLRLSCVETGLCWLWILAVEFCVVCWWIEAALMGTPWCYLSWLCRNEENFEGPSSSRDYQCVMLWAPFPGFSWHISPCRLPMVYMVLL